MYEERIIRDLGAYVQTNYGIRPKTLCDLPKKDLERIKQEIASELRRKGARSCSSSRAKS